MKFTNIATSALLTFVSVATSTEAAVEDSRPDLDTRAYNTRSFVDEGKPMYKGAEFSGNVPRSLRGLQHGYGDGGYGGSGGGWGGWSQKKSCTHKGGSYAHDKWAYDCSPSSQYDKCQCDDGYWKRCQDDDDYCGGWEEDYSPKGKEEDYSPKGKAIWEEDYSPKGEVINVAGKDKNDISYAVDNFRHLLGDPNNGNERGNLKLVGGKYKAIGRREIDWDAAIVPFYFPPDFFKETVTRGLEVSSYSDNFVVSNPPDGKDDKFDSINKEAAYDFQTFSPERLFSPKDDNEFSIHFSFPSDKAEERKHDAVVSGFGVIFTDVDKDHLTKVTYYDVNGHVLAEEFAKPYDKGLSFVGVSFDKPVVYKVVIWAGDVKLNDVWGGEDVVVMDDFIYGEPLPKVFLDYM